jgi:S1-C subfamily serine protease
MAVTEDPSPDPEASPPGAEGLSVAGDWDAPESGDVPGWDVRPRDPYGWGGDPWGTPPSGPPPGAGGGPWGSLPSPDQPPLFGWGQLPGPGQPYGPWQAPSPFTGFTAYPPPPPPPGGKPSRMLPVMVAAGLVIALASGVTGAGIGLALRPSAPATPSGTGGPSPSSQGATPGGGTPSGGSLSAAQVAAAVDPSVVDIVNTLSGGEGTAEGTGMILSSSGEILTNNHVIEDEGSLTVQIDGQGPTYSAQVLGYDANDDVAVVRMLDPPSGLRVAPFGTSSSLSVGDPVVTLGNAYGRGGTPAVAQGAVTGLGESITASDGDLSENLNGMIETDADIVPGDSGGPMVNLAGQVVGMDTAGSSNSTRFGGQPNSTDGFAIPIDTARAVAAKIISGQGGGSIVIGQHGPLIGVEVGNPSDVTSPPFPAVSSGAYIESVLPGSPAARAGLAAGDVITAVNGSQVSDQADLSMSLFDLRPGQTIELVWVDSSGQQHSGSLTLGSGPPK